MLNRFSDYRLEEFKASICKPCDICKTCDPLGHVHFVPIGIM